MGAQLKEVLEKKKAVIVKEWFGQVVDTYPADTSRFLKNQKDPFDNPVGSTTITGLDGLFDELLGETADHARMISLLDPIIRIRAVQDFTPSRAAGFIFFLKKIIRKHTDAGEAKTLAALSRLDERIDELGLLGFDIYMKCRETLMEMKANEMKNRTFRAFERAGLVKEF